MKFQTNTNRILSTVLATTLSLSLFASTSSATEAPTFTDSDTFPTWAVPYITDSANLGLVGGYEDGSFKPEQNMKVREFLVMLTNSYPELEELSQSSVADYYVGDTFTWYGKYVYAAHKSSLLPVGMNPTEQAMEQDITREEAAYMVYTAMTTLGGEYKTMQVQPFNTSNITDYSSIADGKREAVVEMYLKGIMSGYTSGAFGPQDELTRAQLCVIMLALNEPDRRQPYVAPSAGTSNADYPDAVFNENGQQIITEGTVSKRPQAVEGDIVIDANGNQTELKVGDSGVLGAGQGVSADLGLQWPSGGTVTVGGSGNSDQALNSLGNYIGTAKYWQNQITGESHWSNEWPEMTQVPETEGSFKYELSDDKNWYWSTSTWQCVYSTQMQESGLQILKDANGLT